MTGRFVPGVEASGEPGADSLWFLVRGSEILVAADGTAIPTRAELDGLEPEGAHYLGALRGTGCYALGVDGAAVPAGTAFERLRPLHGRLDEERFWLAGRALQIVEWDRTHHHCGRCGTATERVPGERAKRCPACGLAAFPRVSPAIIVRVTRGDEILLARGRRFAEPMYSILAGFVEPGESLEETVAREVREETSVEVEDVRYWGSQPWPFPHSLMVGFTAGYAGGELALADGELVDAGWFRADALPRLPMGYSIARRLIDDWIATRARA